MDRTTLVDKKYFWMFLLAIGLLVIACNAPSLISRGGEEQVGATQIVGVQATAEDAPTLMPTAPIPMSGMPVFAVFEEAQVGVVPASSGEAIAPDLSNVRIPFVLSEEQKALLGQNGFVVSPGTEREFFTLYEKARYDNQPIFVTSDSLLHVYHLLYDKVLRTAEVEYFIPLLRDLNRALLAQTNAQYQQLKGATWEQAALRSVAYVGIASKLLDETVQVPDYARDLVESEIALIGSASGIQPSPLFPGLEFGEDYTQYIPRGHYTLSDALKAYFKSMMWYGRMTFLLKGKDPEVGRQDTRAAILIVNALRNAQVNNQPAMKAWQDLYSPTVFFVGRSDDLTVVQYGDVIDSVYGSNPALDAFVDDAKLDEFIELANQLPPPMILGIVISVEDNVEEATKGMRFMGQRFVPDAYIFRQLIFRNVGTLENPRALPKGLDLFAAMGSERAYQLLDEMGETSYLNYPQQMEKMRAWLAGLTVAEWTETLNNAWLFSFYPLVEEPGPAHPEFMRSTAWLDKQLNTVLGSWTELKHDTILYAKQVYAEMGGGPPPPPPVPPKGYVEPAPQFYARLAALTAMTRTGLESRGLLNELDRDNLQRLEELVGKLQVMAEKELQSEALTEEEYESIRFYGGELEHLTMASADSDAEDPFAPKYMEEDPQAAVVADVATNPNGAPGVDGPAVLEEAVGRINPIYVVVPVVDEDGNTYLQVAKGGVFSYYEFPWPASDRLTDEKWRQMLENKEAPPPPDWVSTFYTVQGEYSELTAGVNLFQEQATMAYWEPVYYMDYGLPAVIDTIGSTLEELIAKKNYFGHQLISSQIRSVDVQSDTQAIVTVREVWQDSLYVGDYPEMEADPIKTRGPYTQDVTYTLHLQTDTEEWQVTTAVYENQPPAW